MRRIWQDDTEGIETLLMGHTVTKVSDDTLTLDNGTRVTVRPNIGCACASGNYYLTALNDVDNIITRVEFDYKPGSDYENNANDGYYRIFVFTVDGRFNLIDIEGTDGNGYYGTGFELVVSVEGDDDV